jgi:hypothetical protein
VFSSSGLLEDGGEELPDESITVVDLADMECPTGNWCQDGGRELGSSSVEEDSPAADRTVAETVDRRLNESRPAERRAAGTLLADYPSAGLGTVADLAERAGLVRHRVMRCAQGLGYDGFTAVPSALRESGSASSSIPETSSSVHSGS